MFPFPLPENINSWAWPCISFLTVLLRYLISLGHKSETPFLTDVVSTHSLNSVVNYLFQEQPLQPSGEGKWQIHPFPSVTWFILTSPLKCHPWNTAVMWRLQKHASLWPSASSFSHTCNSSVSIKQLAILFFLVTSVFQKARSQSLPVFRFGESPLATRWNCVFPSVLDQICSHWLTTGKRGPLFFSLVPNLLIIW